MLTFTRRLLAAATLVASLAVPAAAQTGPAPGPTALAPDVLALACAPSAAVEAPDEPLRITGGQDSHLRDVWAAGDLVTINAGTDDGITVGQEFYVRRLVLGAGDTLSRESPALVQTAGWIRVWAVDDEMSLATITHGCSELRTGDYLVPFVPPVPVEPEAATARAQRENYGRVLLGDDRRTSFGSGDFVTVNRGSDHGVDVGRRFVIYRDRPTPGNFLFELGEAVAVEVGPGISTLLVIEARDAMMTGDYVAMRLPDAP